MDEEQMKNILIENGQAHIIKFYEKLNQEEKDVVRKQVSRINFDMIKELYQKVNTIKEEKKDEIKPINYIDKKKISTIDKEKYEKIGEEKIRKGKLAVVTMAGGQGTRLGHSGPKGTFILDTEKQKSLFQILCETLKKANEKYNVIIPWYIMTSRENNKDTIEFFKQKDFFGYPEDYVFFFKQEELPMLDKQGKLFFDEQKRIKEAADRTWRSI